MVRVIVCGATGQTGSAITRGLLAEPDVQVVGAVAAHAAPDVGVAVGAEPAGVPLDTDLAAVLARTAADVLVDFTVAPVAERHLRLAVEHGVAPVVGTTGLSRDVLAALEKACRERELGAAVIANFSIGAMLLAQFAALAAELLPDAEIVELHHDRKRDRPSGTALRLGQRLEAVTGRPAPIHSVRLPGLVAHHRVIFGGRGEVLTLSHDSLSRDSFVPGVLVAVRHVRELRGRVVYDLEELVALSARRDEPGRAVPSRRRRG
ncbi:dihydrodipicolinate reductase [Thermaerobacter marianensis DSM 12885]|uniref:4-hydroxy-tetrahydrodipicolinate reductase n=1 Tax=Thermaerobacter marianensis (strain ATCC 700841 / DSM 12885 / JCM 10246 / 7p75a) TaxID=644966 RepID=E6SJT1_THEM7|nr:4-hydroxy-tetrahydrodipicolinate reductase [Thermaerobacter marianensis]ADU51144.1 dihydrodipicolinate reductase [Thermaerobacter marianensis DSM 12885]